MSKPGFRGTVALLALLAILVIMNLSIAGKERLLAEGRIVYLELAPVDPRSLMQGDYMALNYRLAEQIAARLPKRNESQPWPAGLAPGSGRVAVSLDERAIASLAGTGDDEQRELTNNEVFLRYRIRNGQLKFATNAYFFQEGTGASYEQARYGQFRVAENGEMLLTALFNEQLQKLGD